MRVPIVPMRVYEGALHQIQYRLVMFADPETGTWIHYCQSRQIGHPWGEAVEMELKPCK
jgi:hypothetical protein